MSYRELFNLIAKPWVSTKEIQQIASCGRDTATRIIKEIEQEIQKSGRKLFRGKTIKVPTKLLLDYLQLDVEYITKMAEQEAMLDLRTKQYASVSK